MLRTGWTYVWTAVTLYAPLKIIENGRGINNKLSSTRQRLVIPYKLPALLLLTPFGITKTCLYNFDPLKPHFYIVKHLYTQGIHLWTQIRSNCHVERFVVKRIIDQYKNRMFIHCRCGLYRKAWLSHDIYLSCISQYWRGIKRAAMLTNRYGHSFSGANHCRKTSKDLHHENMPI